ncbi:hypothetical protein HUJ04_008345 [Dendroctonus ponderosae]|nr:hypothetical protein HUJ04_008345 [Dendroctonus ponderosae]
MVVNHCEKIEKAKGINWSEYRNSVAVNKKSTRKTTSDTDEPKEAWRKYAEALFKDLRANNPTNSTENMSGPKILESEVKYAISCMKSGKSPGHDDIYAEVWSK